MRAMNTHAPTASAIEPRKPTPDESMGMAWWNKMNRSERHLVIAQVEKLLGRPASVADAWALWKSGARLMNAPTRFD